MSMALPQHAAPSIRSNFTELKQSKQSSHIRCLWCSRIFIRNSKNGGKIEKMDGNSKNGGKIENV
jgi:hypothetical protein